jgi:hypothetical protein
VKLLIIVYEDSIDEDLTQCLKEQGVPGYTKVFGAQGEGQHSAPKLGTPVWPGQNNVVYVALPDEAVSPLAATLRELQATYRKRPGLRLFALPMEEL